MDALEAIRTAIGHKFNRGGGDGMAPARSSNGSAERMLSQTELAALSADFQTVNAAIEARDSSLVTDEDVLTLARRFTRTYTIEVFDNDNKKRGSGEVTDAASALDLIQVTAGVGQRTRGWYATSSDGTKISRPTVTGTS